MSVYDNSLEKELNKTLMSVYDQLEVILRNEIWKYNFYNANNSLKKELTSNYKDTV